MQNILHWNSSQVYICHFLWSVKNIEKSFPSPHCLLHKKKQKTWAAFDGYKYQY